MISPEIRYLAGPCRSCRWSRSVTRSVRSSTTAPPPSSAPRSPCSRIACAAAAPRSTPAGAPRTSSASTRRASSPRASGSRGSSIRARSRSRSARSSTTARRSGDQRSPGAGVVTAFARVEGRWCMVIANDNTVASGAWWPRTPEKIQRAQTMALRLRAADGLPRRLQRPVPARADRAASRARRGAGHIFKMNSLLSAHGVPQIAGVFGDCIAGGGYMPIISRPRLHDRAGVHGDRRRRADQRREEPEDDVARHRRPRGPRPPVRLRRRARPRRRRRCSRASAATIAAPAARAAPTSTAATSARSIRASPTGELAGL